MNPLSEPRSTLSQQDIAALRAHAESDSRNVLSREWAKMAAQYEVNAVRMPPHGPAIRGRDAIRKSFDAMPPITGFTFDMVDVQGAGDLAFMHATWSIRVRPPGTADDIEDAGKILIVFRKQADGTWLRAADAWNSDA